MKLTTTAAHNNVSCTSGDLSSRLVDIADEQMSASPHKLSSYRRFFERRLCDTKQSLGQHHGDRLSTARTGRKQVASSDRYVPPLQKDLVARFLLPKYP